MRLDRVIVARKSKKVYQDNEKVIKIFDNNYSKADIFNEALNQARVEETDLNIPKIIEVTQIDGKWAIISQYIEGKTLDELINENPDNLDEYLNLFVDLQVKIHLQKAPLLNKLKDKMLMKISKTDLDATTRYDLQTRLEGMPKHYKVCHGDFNPSNVIITQEGTPYILDWSHVTQGNASADIAKTYLLFCLSDKRDLADKYLHLICEKSEIKKEYMQKWLPIVAASQINKVKSNERKLLLNWINVVDYD